MMIDKTYVISVFGNIKALAKRNGFSASISNQGVTFEVCSSARKVFSNGAKKEFIPFKDYNSKEEAVDGIYEKILNGCYSLKSSAPEKAILSKEKRLEIMSRMMIAAGARNIAELARILGRSREGLRQWRHLQDGVPQKHRENFCEKYGVRREWLDTGGGAMHKTPEDTLSDINLEGKMMDKTNKQNIGYSLERISLDILALANSMPNQITKMLAQCEYPVVFLTINKDHIWSSYELDQVAEFNRSASSLIDKSKELSGLLFEVNAGQLESSCDPIIAFYKSKSDEAFAPIVYETISGKEILLPIMVFPWY